MRKIRFRTVFILIAFFGILIFKTYDIINPALKISNKSKEYSALKATLAELKQEEIILTSEVEKLKDSSYIARYAREKYLMSKDGEVIIKMPEWWHFYFVYDILYGVGWFVWI